MRRFLFALTMIATVFACTLAWGADADTAVVATAYENPKGRAVVFDTSELITVWHTGSGVTTAHIGVSKTTVGWSRGSIVFYEDAQPLTTETRFGGYPHIDLHSATADTVDEVVSLINSDTSGKFKACRGRDATPQTSTTQVLARNVQSLGSTYGTGASVLNDTDNANLMTAGFRARDGFTYRLKSMEETAQGTGIHYITVWDDATCVYRRVYLSADTYTAENILPAVGHEGEYDRLGVTPLTIQFSDAGCVGLCASEGKSLVVGSRWSATMAGQSVEDENLSILVGEFRH